MSDTSGHPIRAVDDERDPGGERPLAPEDADVVIEAGEAHGDLPLEASAADVLEQQLDVILDDERDG